MLTDGADSSVRSSEMAGLEQLPDLVQQSASAIRDAKNLPEDEAVASIAAPLVSAVATVARAAGDSIESIGETIEDAADVLSRLLDPDSETSPINKSRDCVDDSEDQARDLLAVALLVWALKEQIKIQKQIAQAAAERSQIYRQDLEVDFDRFLAQASVSRAALIAELDELREQYTERLYITSSQSRKEYDQALIALQELRRRLLEARAG